MPLNMNFERSFNYEIYAVYNVNEIGALRWIDSYWLSYEKAVERFKKLWIFCREPDEDEIKHYVKCMKTED